MGVLRWVLATGGVTVVVTGAVAAALVVPGSPWSGAGQAQVQSKTALKTKQVAAVEWVSTSARPWRGDPDAAAGHSSRALGPRRAAAPEKPEAPLPPWPMEEPIRPILTNGPSLGTCPDVGGRAPAAGTCPLEPLRSCPGFTGPAAHVRTQVEVVGKDSVRLTWWANGDPDAIRYEIAIVPLVPNGVDQPTWRVFPLGAPCAERTVVLDKIPPGRYIFLVETRNVNHANHLPVVHRDIGRTETVRLG